MEFEWNENKAKRNRKINYWLYIIQNVINYPVD